MAEDSSTIVLGSEYTLYVGAAGGTTSTEVSLVGDVDVNIEWRTVALATRNDVNELKVAVRRILGLEFNLVKNGDASTYGVIAAAAKNKTPIYFKSVDPAGYGIEGDWIIEKFPEPQPIDGFTAHKVSCAPTIGKACEFIAPAPPAPGG